MSTDIVKAALDMVSRKDVISAFGLMDGEGFPFVSAVVVIKNYGMRKFWISTSPESRKAELIGAGCKAGLCWYDETKNVTLMGTAEIVTDEKLKKDLWLDWMKNFYTKGPEDESYCLIKFTTLKARLLISGTARDFSVGEIGEALS
jgi:general stress protein 26